MGTAATKAKRKWNKEHYTNLTLALNPHLASELKAVCKARGVSVTSVMSLFAREYLNCEAPLCEKKPEKQSVNNRGRRKKVLAKHTAAIENILSRKETYLNNIPENLRQSVRCEKAENSVEHLPLAVDELKEVYAQGVRHEVIL